MALRRNPWRAHPHVRTGDELSLGERAADAAVRAMGSWAFIGWQTGIVILWIGVNLAAVALRWDPYPFILLNLAFSTQAAYAAPLILLASRRQDARNAELAAADLDTDRQALTILKQLAELAAADLDTDRQALTILKQLAKHAGIQP